MSRSARTLDAIGVFESPAALACGPFTVLLAGTAVEPRPYQLRISTNARSPISPIFLSPRGACGRRYRSIRSIQWLPGKILSVEAGFMALGKLHRWVQREHRATVASLFVVYQPARVG